MKPRTKTIFLTLAWIATTVIAYSAGAFPAWSEHKFGKRYDWNRGDHKRELLRLVYLAQPALREIQAFVQSNHRAPNDNEFARMTSLSVAYREACLDSDIGVNGWKYMSDGSEFNLFYKLGWDSSLHYSSRDNTWLYDPGDGRPSTTLIP